MSMIEERLAAAINAKNNDINSYTWKGPKEEIGGQRIQREIKLMDASEKDLNRFYRHCKSMLYNKDPFNPGRVVLINMIQQDREKCNAELYLRYLENSYHHEDNRARCLRFQHLQDIRNYLSRNTDTFPLEKQYEIPISDLIENVPDEFSRVSIGLIMDSCLDKTGRINKKPITLNFILKLGVWFEPEELKDLVEKDPETGKTRDRLLVVKERLGLKANAKLRIDPTGLNYQELRSMVNLRAKKFSDLTTDQLIVLRDKVLFRLEDEAVSHMQLWLDQIGKIKEVARAKGYYLEEDE